MDKPSRSYQPLGQEDLDIALPQLQQTGRPRIWLTRFLAIALCISLLLHAATLLSTSSPDSSRIPRPPFDQAESPFANLKFDTPITWDWSTLYGAAGLDQPHEQDRLWEAYTISDGVTALKTSDALSLGLPPSQPFPWDKSRSIYLTSGFHSLHCLKKIRRYIVQTARNQTPFDELEHIAHCLDSLRQDILCWADDTPQHYVALNGTGHKGTTGQGQTRMCRDWTKMEAWGQQHNACYAFINETEGVSAEVERYKYCPEGSVFGANMRRFFGFGDDYVGVPVEAVPDYSP